MEKKCKPLVSMLKRRTGSITVITMLKLVGKQCLEGRRSHGTGRPRSCTHPRRVWCPLWVDNPKVLRAQQVNGWQGWSWGGSGGAGGSRTLAKLSIWAEVSKSQRALVLQNPCLTPWVILSDF